MIIFKPLPTAKKTYYSTHEHTDVEPTVSPTVGHSYWITVQK